MCHDPCTMPAWLISALTVGLDQLTKRWVSKAFAPGDTLPLVQPIVSLTYVQNTGAAFGLFKGQQPLFIGVSLLVIGWVVWELRASSATRPAQAWGAALILGGAIGNLIDRLRLGYVIDFIDLHVWPVFNIGDSAITVGVSLLLLSHLLPADRARGVRGRGRGRPYE